MAELSFERETIDYLVERVQKSGLKKLRLCCDAFEIEIESGASEPAEVSKPAGTAKKAPADVSGGEEDGHLVLSPIVGTFYDSPAPDKPAFVKVGSKVKKGDVLFIIESMKLMNEIKSEVDGTVEKILVASGDAVEYHQPILCIR